MPWAEKQWELLDHCHECLARLYYNDDLGTYKWKGGSPECIHIREKLWTQAEKENEANQ